MTTIVLGELVKPVGLRGQLKLKESADFWEAALQSKHLRLRLGSERRAVSVAASRVQSAGMRVLTLEGILDRNAAEALVGGELTLESANLDVEEPPLLRPFQVLDVEVVLPDGSRLGRVAELLQLPANDVFVVQGESKEYLIPDIPSVVEELDLQAGKMRIRPLPGLLEL